MTITSFTMPAPLFPPPDPIVVAALRDLQFACGTLADDPADESVLAADAS